MKEIKKRGWISLILFFIVFTSASAKPLSIYDLINGIKKNPDNYMFIIGEGIDKEVSNAVVALSNALSVKKSKGDFETKITESNMIVIGNSEKNKITRGLIGPWDYENGAIISLDGNNLIIGGKDKDGLIKAINLLRDYNNNKNLLSSNEVFLKNGRWQKAEIISIKRETKRGVYSKKAKAIEMMSENKKSIVVGIVVLIVIVGGLAIGFFIKKSMGEKKEGSIQQEYTQEYTRELENYISGNLRRGYTKEQIKAALLREGWEDKVIEETFRKFGV